MVSHIHDLIHRNYARKPELWQDHCTATPTNESEQATPVRTPASPPKEHQTTTSTKGVVTMIMMASQTKGQTSLQVTRPFPPCRESLWSCEKKNGKKEFDIKRHVDTLNVYHAFSIVSECLRIYLEPATCKMSPPLKTKWPDTLHEVSKELLYIVIHRPIFCLYSIVDEESKIRVEIRLHHHELDHLQSFEEKRY